MLKFIVMQPNLDEIKKIIQLIIDQEQIELVDLICRFENGRNVLRLLIDSPGGITLDDCAKINRQISQALEQSDLLSQHSVIEVNSPGLDRPMVTKRDFEKKIGSTIRLIAKNNKGTTDIIVGDIKNVDDDKVVLISDNKESEILLGDIIKAKLEIR